MREYHNSLGRKINLRASEEEKYSNDNQWFKDVMNSIVPSYLSTIDEHEKLLMNYQIVNNDISKFKQYIENYCNMFNTNITESEINELLPYNRLHNKKNVLVGELIARNEAYRVVLLSSDAIKEKDDLFTQALKESIQEKMAIEMEAMQKNMSPQEKEEFEKQNRTHQEPEEIVNNRNFKTSWELFYEHAIKYCVYSQDIKSKRAESWEDVIISDRCVLYVGFDHGEPTIKVVNPIYVGFHKSPNEPYIQKSDYVWYRDTITIAQAIQEYNLTDEEINQLGIGQYSTSPRDPRHDVLGNNASPIRDMHHLEEFRAIHDRQSFADKRTGTHQAQGLSRALNTTDLIWRTHLEFKAYRKLYFRSYTNDYGKKITEILTDDYKIPAIADKAEEETKYGDKYETYRWYDNELEREFKLEVHYIPRKYEVERIGNIFRNCREVPMQPLNINRPYSSFELSYKGTVFTDRNSESVSLVERAIPYQFQYFFVKILQNRELAKYKSFVQSVDADQIPIGLGLDENGEKIQDHVAAYLEFLKSTNIDLYSGSQTTSGGLPPSTRSPGARVSVLGTAAELINLQNLLEYIDREISMSMGISPQREAQFSSNTNVSDNRQAIAQSHHITELYFFKFNEIWKHAINDWLRLYTIYVEDILEENADEHFIHYITPEGTEELFKVTKSNIYHNDIGLWVTDAGQEQRYHETMMQMVHAFAQNAGEGVEIVSSITKAITSGASAAEVHRMIEKESERQQQRAMQAQQAQQEAEKKLIEEQMKAREDIQAHEIEKIVVKEVERRTTELQKEQLRGQNDFDKNGIPDDIQRLKQIEVLAKQELERQKLELEKQKHKDDVMLREKEIKAKNKPAS